MKGFGVGALAKREGGKAAGERDWKDYLFAVRQSPRGLKERLNLDYRIELLESSVSNDRQALYISHLAKTLALKGEEQEAMYWLGAWHKALKAMTDMTDWNYLINQYREQREGRRRWKKASLSLELRVARKNNDEASLTAEQWKRGRKFCGVHQEEVEDEVTRQAGDPGLYLFDQQDEDLVKPDASS